jgi:5-methylcytosine-specific restriction enzyme A
MKTFLFTWNPENWNWDEQEKQIKKLSKTGSISQQWKIGNLSAKPGDRAFLIRLGKKPKGIIGSGYITSPPFKDIHWKEDGKFAYYVNIDFEVLLNPEKGDDILNLEILEKGKLSTQEWTPNQSGILIKPEVTHKLEMVWFDFLSTKKFRVIPFAFSEKEEKYSEGNPYQITLTKYERNYIARNKCIEHHGLSCKICKFNFEKIYGKKGAGFIHVHHLKPLSTIRKTYSVDPVKDLIPVCPNCHAIIHKQNPPFNVDEMRNFLKK